MRVCTDISYARDHVDASLAQLAALLKGVPPSEAEKLIRERLDGWKKTRVGKISNNEAVAAANYYARQTYQACGVTKLRWVTQGNKSCPFCKQLNGKIVGIKESFLEKGATLSGGKGGLTTRRAVKHPPIHRGCRCAIVPEIASFHRERAEEFISRRDMLPDGLKGFVTAYSNEEYRQMGAEFFLSETGQAGFAIARKSGNELVSVFSLPGVSEGYTVVYEAIKAGAECLWCFNTGLPELYGLYGFIKKEYYPWDDNYAPVNWNYQKFGKPDVFYMTREQGKNLGEKGKKSTGRRVGNLWIEDDGTAKTLFTKMREVSVPLSSDAPRNHGTEEFQRLYREYLQLLFADALGGAIKERDEKNLNA